MAVCVTLPIIFAVDCATNVIFLPACWKFTIAPFFPMVKVSSRYHRTKFVCPLITVLNVY